MYKSTTLLGVTALLLFLLSSCSKSVEIIPAPTACFHIEELEVSTSQNMVFENCSESDICYLRIYAAADFEEGVDQSTEQIINWDFNATTTIEHQFTAEKRYIAEIFCQNKESGSPIVLKTQEFEVKN